MASKGRPTGHFGGYKTGLKIYPEFSCVITQQEYLDRVVKNELKERKMNNKQKNSYRRFLRAARKAGATSFQRGYHGCGKYSAQGFDVSGKLVCDWNL